MVNVVPTDFQVIFALKLLAQLLEETVDLLFVPSSAVCIMDCVSAISLQHTFFMSQLTKILHTTGTDLRWKSNFHNC